MVTRDVVVQIELWEGEVDNLNGVKKKSKAQVQQLQRTEEQIRRHRNHVDRLQQMLRLLDNEAVLVWSICLFVSVGPGQPMVLILHPPLAKTTTSCLQSVSCPLAF
jgi:hypothetical protein